MEFILSKKFKKILERFSFTKVFDLQNSSRTEFYKRFLFKKNIFWSYKKSFATKRSNYKRKNLPVLDRIENQLMRAGLKDVSFTKKPDLSWAIKNVKNIVNRNFEGDYILVFPFCSPKLVKKNGHFTIC